MNIESYNPYSLRTLVRDLEKENKTLKNLLNAADIPYPTEEIYSESPITSEEFDPDQGGRIIHPNRIDDNILMGQMFSACTLSLRMEHAIF